MPKYKIVPSNTEQPQDKTVEVKLVDYGGDLALMVRSDEGGWWYVCRLLESGKLKLHKAIPLDTGLDVTDDGKIRVA